MPKGVKDAVLEGEFGDDLAVMQRQIRMPEQKDAEFQFLEAACSGPARAGQQRILHRGGDGVATAGETGARRRTAPTPEAATTVIAARLVLGLRLRGRGWPGRTAGDQIVTLAVHVPKAETAEQREAYEALAKVFDDYDPRA